jgi:multidrug resistance protein
LSRPLLLVAATGFLLMLGLSVLFPVLGFFTRELAMSDFEAGMMMSSYALASFVTAPFWGRYSDRVGRRPAILIGLMGFSLAFGLFGLGSSFWELLGARLLGGALAAAAMPAVFAYVSDVTTAERRSTALGMLGASFGLGVIAGPILGGLVAASYGVRAPFFLASAIGLVAAVAVMFLLPESLTPEIRKANAERRRGLEALGLGTTAIAARLAPFLGYSFLVQTGRMGLESTLAFLLADRFEGTVRDVGLLLMFVGLIAAVVQGGAIRPLSQRFSDRALMLFGTGLLAVGLAGLGFANNWYAMALAAGTLALGAALQTPTFTAELSRGAEEFAGEAQGLNSSAMSLGRVVGPLLFTALYSAAGTVIPYLVAGLVVLLALVLAIFRVRPLESGSGTLADASSTTD